MSDDQYRRLEKLLRSNQNMAGSAMPTIGVPPGLEALGKGSAEAAGKLGPLGKAAEVGKEAFDKLQKGVEAGLGTFRDLSRTGASFSNDVIGMSIAATQSRMNLNEFADVIKSNNINFAGLGGNVVRGAEAFTKLSKDMFDSGITDSLKQMGYTNKELNEVLALQIGFGRSSIRDDEASRKKTIQSAAELATEMDLMAKMTGKTREEQADALKKAQADMQVEAKFRLIGAKQGPEAEARAREAFAKQYNEAQLRGQGQMFKEVFATGNVMSKEAGMQVALQGKAATATIEQARATSQGNIERATAASRRAEAETLKNQNSVALNTLASVGSAGGEVTKSIHENMTANRAMYDSIQKLRQDPANKGKTEAELAEMARKDAKAAQAGMNKQGEAVDGATKAVIQLGNRIDDVNSAIATSMIDPAKRFGKTLDAISEKYLSGQVTVKNKEGAATGTERLAPYIERNIKTGYDEATSGEPKEPKEPPKGSSRRRPSVIEPDTSGQALQSAGALLGNLTTLTTGAVEKVFLNGKEIPGRSSGSVGETGKLIEDFGAGTLTMLHGKEGVVTEDQLKQMALGMKSEGVANAVSQLTSALPTAGSDNKQPGINVAQISKTISSTISSSIGGETTTKRVQSDSSKDAEKELKSVKEQYAAERTALAAKFKEMMPDASVGERRKAMNASDDAKSLNAKYDALMKPLEKKIEEGISYEVERKTDAVEEAKKIVEEELSVIKIKNADLLEETKTASKEEIAAKEKERAEIIKQADLTRSIVGTNVKGMTDEAVEALLPAGTKLEDYYEDINGNLQSFAVDGANKLQKVIEDEKAANLAQLELDSIGTNLTNVIPKNITLPKFDEFAGLDDAILQQKKISQADIKIKEMQSTSNVSSDIGGFTLGPNGLPIANQIRAKSSEIPGAIKETQAQANKKPEATNTESAPAQKREEPKSAPAADSKAATLNDVVKSIDQLNKQMAQLLAQSEEFGNKQVRATKANNQNIFAR